jgi:hypothetical protein
MRKPEQAKVLKLFNGNKTQKPIRDAREIAWRVGVSRREVMKYLESQNLRTYAPGSYN